MSSAPTIAVRLEGGLGDHILGMRVLRFVRNRYPAHGIAVYSDSGGHSTPIQIVSMSPFVSNVVALARRAPQTIVSEEGELSATRERDIASMMSADVFIDSYSGLMFSDAARLLDVPIFSILAHQTELVVSENEHRKADRVLNLGSDTILVGMSLAKFGGGVLTRNVSLITHVLHRLLEDPRVVVLNMFTSSYDYPHWPEPDRTRRRSTSVSDGAFLCKLCAMSNRIIPCVNLPITTIAALLTRCRYFIGVDNGIKHLAWALGVPRTYFHPVKPSMQHVLRWMPDVHRMLLFGCSRTDLEKHIDAALMATHE